MQQSQAHHLGKACQLNDKPLMRSSDSKRSVLNKVSFAGGGDWIRTSVGVSQQIYSLPPLATRAPLLSESGIMPLFSRPQQALRRKLPNNWFFILRRQPLVHLSKVTTPHEWQGRPERRQWRGVIGPQNQMVPRLRQALDVRSLALGMSTPQQECLRLGIGRQRRDKLVS